MQYKMIVQEILQRLHDLFDTTSPHRSTAQPHFFTHYLQSPNLRISKSPNLGISESANQRISKSRMKYILLFVPCITNAYTNAYMHAVALYHCCIRTIWSVTWKCNGKSHNLWLMRKWDFHGIMYLGIQPSYEGESKYIHIRYTRNVIFKSEWLQVLSTPAFLVSWMWRNAPLNYLSPYFL